MLEVYTWPTPNGHKVHIALEELGLRYKVIPVNIGAGAQFKPEFLKIRQTTGSRRSSTPTAPTASRLRCSNRPQS